MNSEIEFGIDQEGTPVTYSAFSAHTVVSGATRSGKSATTYNLLLGAARDDRLQLCGIDPSGVLLSPHSNAGREDQFVLSTSPSEIDRAVELLKRLVAEMDARNRRLMRTGVDKIPTEWLSPRLPAVVLVLEEYAGLLSAAEKRSKEITSLVGRILREGAKASIHVLTILQRPEASLLHDRAQYSRRICHRLDNADSVRMLLEAADTDQVQTLMNVAPGVGYLHLAGDPMRLFRSTLIDYNSQYAPLVRLACEGRPPMPWLSERK